MTETDPTRPRVVRRRLGPAAARWWPIGAALVVVAVAAGVAVANHRDERLRADVGDVVQNDVYATATDTGELRLPSGVVDVETTRPLGSSPQLPGRDAPEGGSWVGLMIADQAEKPLPQPTGVSSSDNPRPRIIVELVVGGRAYPVPRKSSLSQPIDTDDAVARNAWVAVAGRSSDVRVAITYDGVKQTLRPSDGTRTTGRAAPLYNLPFASATDAAGPSCGTVRFPTSYTQTDSEYAPVCTARQYPLLPYLPQLGWAPKSKQWLALQIGNNGFVAVRWRGRGSEQVEYNINRVPTLQVSVDGSTARMSSATAPTLRRTAGLNPTYLAVFAVPASAAAQRLTVALQWHDLDTTDGPPPAGAPRSPDLALTWTKELS